MKGNVMVFLNIWDIFCFVNETLRWAALIIQLLDVDDSMLGQKFRTFLGLIFLQNIYRKLGSWWCFNL